MYEPSNATFEIGAYGAIDGATVTWSSSIDGALGESIVVSEQSVLIVESLSSGVHEITATVLNEGSTCGECCVNLSFGLPPSIAFLSPDEGLTFGSEDEVAYAVQSFRCR